MNIALQSQINLIRQAQTSTLGVSTKNSQFSSALLNPNLSNTNASFTSTLLNSQKLADINNINALLIQNSNQLSYHSRSAGPANIFHDFLGSSHRQLLSLENRILDYSKGLLQNIYKTSSNITNDFKTSITPLVDNAVDSLASLSSKTPIQLLLPNSSKASQLNLNQQIYTPHQKPKALLQRSHHQYSSKSGLSKKQSEQKNFQQLKRTPDNLFTKFKKLTKLVGRYMERF